MLLLALDTSTSMASVAVVRDRELVAERDRLVTTHSESLIALVDECLAAAQVALNDVDAVACGAGPGSFTGLRIGLATAKGLCWALPKPLVMISSLAAIAARAPDGICCATIDAYKGEIYAARFSVVAGAPLLDGDERVLPPEALAEELRAQAPLTIAGSGAAKYPQLLVDGVRLLDERPGPRARDVAFLALARAQNGDFDDLAAAAPRYIRPSEAELVKAGRQR
jgi:tRNA threonylcarbamoyladenosine biosynthesis protein TsaB